MVSAILISCLDDIIVMLRSDWPTSERAVEPAGLYTRYVLQVLGCTRHRSGCPISLRDVLISLAAETS